MKLDEIGMIVISSNRSKAYLQILANNNYFPSHVIIMDNSGSGTVMPGQRKEDVSDMKAAASDKGQPEDNAAPACRINFGESLLETIERFGVSYEICPSTDINSVIVRQCLSRRPEKYFIYSGAGGVLLRKDVLRLGKQFLHIHPGLIPDFRGSTTVYYSILMRGNCGASAIFLNEQIDTGPLIKMKTYPEPDDGTKIDYEYDPEVRADLLLEVIGGYVMAGGFNTTSQAHSVGQPYFIIHPVLRHIAILSCNAGRTQDTA